MSALRLLILGAAGRMGQAIVRCAGEDAEVRVSAEIGRNDDFRAALGGCDAVIDFSHHDVTVAVAAACAAAGKPLVIGTTGHREAEIAAIQAAAQRVAIVFAPNFSIGVNTLFWLTQKAVEILGPDFDLEVVEMHHRLKKDAPSGTAKRLAEILAEAHGRQYAADVKHGREGLVGARTATEIGMHALRGGDVVGDHTVIFANMGERVELTHKASSRDTFAKGSIRAAKWAAQQPAGLYDMQDVLALR